MASKYQIWNKTDIIYTPGVGANGKGSFTPEEWIAQWPWAGIPGVKAVIAKGPINGALIHEFDQFKTMYKGMGAEITDEMTDEEVLDAVEAWENRPAPEPTPSPEERIAAALEEQNLNAMPDA